MKYAGVFEQSGQAVGLTVMIFVGQNYGAVKFNRIREDVCKGLLLTVIKNLPIAFLEIALPVQIASIMSSSEWVL